MSLQQKLPLTSRCYCLYLTPFHLSSCWYCHYLTPFFFCNFNHSGFINKGIISERLFEKDQGCSKIIQSPHPWCQRTVRTVSWLLHLITSFSAPTSPHIWDNGRSNLVRSSNALMLLFQQFPMMHRLQCPQSLKQMCLFKLYRFWLHGVFHRSFSEDNADMA